MIQRILVPLDGSADSETVLPTTVSIAKAFDAEVIVLHVDDGTRSSEDGRAYLRRICSTVRGIRIMSGLRFGIAAEQILSYASTASADLIAMATHGRGGLRRLYAGSVAESVLRRSAVPLLLQRPGNAAPMGGRILTPLDGSLRAESVLRDVGSLARALRAEVDLVQVVLPPIHLGGVAEIPFTYEPEDPEPYLESVGERLHADSVASRPVTLVGRAGSEIVRYAAESKASLICMTTHGRDGIGRAILGSIAEDVIRHAPCAVFVRRAVSTPVAV